MAPVKSDTCDKDIIEICLNIGLSEAKANETAKNALVSKQLANISAEYNRCCPDKSGIDRQHGILLYHIATKLKQQIQHHLSLLVHYIAGSKLTSELQLNAALDFLIANPNANVDIKSFEEATGVGVVISQDMIEEEVEKAIAKYKDQILSKRYHYNTGLLMQEARKTLKWADGKTLKTEIDLQLHELLGPKEESDFAPQPKTNKKPVKADKDKTLSSAHNGLKNGKDIPTKAADTVENGSAAPQTMSEVFRTQIQLHKPGENFKTDGYVVTPNTMRLLEEHKKVTGGQVRTRFPPEPNGILHIGHAKAININFGYAKANNGVCILRYDDTNPDKEEEDFFIGIKDLVEWLGFKPYKITHSSDYFDQLYEFAKVLIHDDLAYVCHQKSEEIKGFNKPASPWRNRPVQESLKLFEDMKNGKLNEGEATLRMKLLLAEGKSDPVAYRIKYLPHARSGDKWCIYPTYDFTHCLCDSIENITHSLCTKEFQSRRPSYYWLCNSLNVYCPVQWEYGRLNMNYTVVSKRKILKLIEEGIVNGWDDPRLFTLTALRRRGFPPEAINSFCAKMGVTGAQVTVDPSMLEAHVRDCLNVTAPRTMVVIEPLKVRIVNHSSSVPVEIEVPNLPGEPAKGGVHKILMSDTIYIEKSDFKETSEKDYKRLMPNQPVGLKYAGIVLTLHEVIHDEHGQLKEILVTSAPVANAEKPKAYIHWVSHPISVEIRNYERLFNHKNPEDPDEVPGGFISDCNPNSISITESFADCHLRSCKPYDKFQFERIGYFSVDPDSSENKLVFNRTVTLRDSAKNC